VLEVLKGYKASLAAVEEKMAAVQPLSDSEQSLYDSLDSEGLDAKTAWLTETMEGMVSGGLLTKREQQQVLEQMAGKLEALEEQIAISESGGKAKRAEKLAEMRAEMLAKSAALREAKPIVRKPKFEAEIRAARKKLAELEKLENSKVVLPLAEIQKLNAKPKLLEDLAAMEADAAGWFGEASTS